MFGRSEASVELFEVWGQRGWPNVDVVGESFHTDEIKRLLANEKAKDGNEVLVPVQLVRDPKNAHDRNAIEVRGATGVLGHLSREDAVRYAPVLDRLLQRGLVAATTGRVYGYEGEDWETGKKRFVGSVRVDLPEPHMLAPRNAPPSDAHELIPTGHAIQVAGEENHMDAIAPFLNQDGQCWVYASLHEVEEVGARSSKAFAEVRIDGNAVGRLSLKLSGDVLPAVRYLAERGRVTCVRAVVKGNRLKAEVVVYAARAHELASDWFDDVQTSALAVRGSDGGDAHTASDDGERPEAAPPPLPPADWYSDPYGKARLRYWDGVQWTGATSP